MLGAGMIAGVWTESIRCGISACNLGVVGDSKHRN